MLSRVAERVYWMARYVERAENSARITNVYTNLLLDLPRNTAIGWHSLIAITGSTKCYRALYKDDSERHIMKFLLADSRNPGSLINSLCYARENARTIRGNLPREGWEHLNELYSISKSELSTSLSRRSRYEFLALLIGAVQRLTGVLAGTMNHNYGYHFLRIGRHLERADMTTRILDAMTVNTFPDEEPGENVSYSYTLLMNVLWMNVLKSLSAYQSYRHEGYTAISRDNVLKFVLQNRDFPRAILHTLFEIQNSIQQLPRHNKTIRQLNRIIRVIQTTEVSALNTKALHTFMDTLQIDIANFNQHFGETYFAVLETRPKTASDNTSKKIISPKIQHKPEKMYVEQPAVL